MSDSDENQKRRSSNETVTDDVTVTSNDQNYGDSDRLRVQHLKTLLGTTALRTNVKEDYLVRIEQDQGAAELLDLYSKNLSLNSPLRLPTDELSCIIGPVSEEKLKEWAEAGQIRSTILVQKPFDRWKEVGMVFPDWIFRMVQDEPRQGDFGGEGEDNGESTRSGRDLTREVEIVQIANQQQSVTLSRQTTARISSDRTARKSDKQSLLSNLLPLLGLGVVISLAVAYVVTNGRFVRKFIPKPEVTGSQLEIPKAAVPFEGAVAESEWPVELRPRTYDEIKSEEFGNFKSIAQILSSFERGMTLLDDRDSAILRRAADPAAASFEGRKVASNLLAVFKFGNEPQEARKLLERVLEQDPTDLITLINLGLMNYQAKNYEKALDNFEIVRRVSESYDWLMYALIGAIQYDQEKPDEAIQSFKNALRIRPGHPYIYGLWLKGAVTGSHISSSEVSDLVSKALWSDHDLARDSPLPTPLMSSYIVELSRTGWERSLQYARSSLSLGKRTFIDWLSERDLGSLSANNKRSESRELLVKEDDPLSKILLAYLLIDHKMFDEAAVVLNKTLPTLGDGRGVDSSWPWSMAGELRLHRGYYAQATEYFNRAVHKNGSDATALNGLAVIARALGNYSTASTRFNEASGLDPFFLPAKMKVSRIQARTRLK